MYSNYSHLESAALIGMIIGIIIGLLIGYTILILFLLTLRNTMNEVSPENQKMPPAQIWLGLIPLFGTVWMFFIVIRLSESLQAEFAKRNIRHNEQRPGYNLGLACCILSCCGYIPFIGGLAGLAALICFIIYWVNVAGYKKILLSNPVRQQF